MTLCTTADLRKLIDSQTLADADYSNILDIASLEVVQRAGRGATVSTVNDNLRLATLYLAGAMILRQMRITGEMAASLKLGNAVQNNTPDPDIQSYEASCKHFIILYRLEGGVSLPYGRPGPGVVDSTTNYTSQ